MPREAGPLASAPEKPLTGIYGDRLGPDRDRDVRSLCLAGLDDAPSKLARPCGAELHQGCVPGVALVEMLGGSFKY